MWRHKNCAPINFSYFHSRFVQINNKIKSEEKEHILWRREEKLFIFFYFIRWQISIFVFSDEWILHTKFFLVYSGRRLFYCLFVPFIVCHKRSKAKLFAIIKPTWSECEYKQWTKTISRATQLPTSLFPYRIHGIDELRQCCSSFFRYNIWPRTTDKRRFHSRKE